MKWLAVVLVGVFVATAPTGAAAQPAAGRATVTLTSAAPVFLLPNANRTPLRIAAEGSVLNLLGTDGEWYHVEFDDPQLGRRVGFVQAKYARVSAPATQPAGPAVHEQPPSPATTMMHLEDPPPAAATAAETVARPGGPATPSGAAAARAARPTLYITPTADHFERYLSAAIAKKAVPVTVTTNPERATLVLSAMAVDVQQQSGASKVARCLFASCAGIEDSGATSVQLLADDIVVWSYSVNNGRGQENRQSLAEAIAKHLKDEYLHIR